MAIRKIPCAYMRCGTSKAVIFNKKDLPVDQNEWSGIFLKGMGSPDAKQIDGMGGGTPATSKIAIVSKSDRPDADIDYTFCQVAVNEPVLIWNANCGNTSSAIGPYAIDEGMVNVTYPETTVRIFNTNTQKLIEEHVLVEDGHAAVQGNASISGVPGTAAPVKMYFVDPGGAVTGKLFPTGHRKEMLQIPGGGEIEASIVDCSNPIVFVRAADLNLKGTEIKEFGENKDLLNVIEKIRSVAAVKCGIVDQWEDAKVKSAAIPKVVIISSPQDYRNSSGSLVKGSAMDLCVRAINMGSLHKDYPITAAICTGAAALLSGTIVNEMLPPQGEKSVIRLGHPGGILEVSMEVRDGKVVKGGIIRTARRIMDGNLYL
jgi:2-methylaconitate cis-trans-isomerase PrpF